MEKDKKNTASEIIENAKKLAFYTRVSTKDQSDLKHQTGVVESYLDRYGKKYTKNYPDEISAYSKSYEKREAFNELLNDVENKEYDAIVVSDRDRLSRQTDEHITLREKLKQLGIPVIIASQDEIYSDDDFIKNLVEDALTKLESDTISTRTKATMQTLAEKGKYIGGKPPFGFEAEKKANQKHGKSKQVVVGYNAIPEEIGIVKEIFTLYRGGETFSSIAKKLLSKASSKKKGSYGERKWSSNTIRGIILNPIYTGHFVYNRYADGKNGYNFKPVDQWQWVKCPFIKDPPISTEEWWYCWRKYQSTSKKEPRYLNTPYYFSKIITCYCDTFMRGKDQRTKGKDGELDGYRYYVCPSCKCKVKTDDLHDLFFKLINNITTPEEYVVDEIKKLLETDLEEAKLTISNLIIKINEEEENLRTYKKFGSIEKSEDVHLFDSKNPNVLAYLISKKNSEDKLEKYKYQSNQLKVSNEKLEDLIKNDGVIKETVKRVINNLSTNEQSDLEKRNLVLLVIEQCALTAPNKVKFKIKSVPPKIMGL